MIDILLKPYNLSLLTGLLAAIAYKIRYVHEQNPSDWTIIGLLLFVVSFEFYAYYLASQTKSTLTFYNISYVTIETLILFIYFRQISASRVLKRYTLVFPVILLLFIVLNHFMWQSFLTSYQSYSFFVAAIGICLFCCLYFWEIIRYNRFIDQPLYTVSHFWNIAVLMAFYSGAFLFSLSVTKIQFLIFEQHRFLGDLLSVLNQFLAGLLYLTLGFSPWISKALGPKSHVETT
ncbi:MAG: hypothetical protein JJU34_20185 [Lunatimonas sp.]|uniref:hypothetical protein n=1 Tax=Lunatimonas sp. TaxID=2060141 RepID=UPI00263B2F47|nr:hypothetical protein [Lunatimonas sp.]MCC5939610.1 hypothetical protein [Lunatimonas sp.]